MDPILKALEYSVVGNEFVNQIQRYDDYRSNYQKDLSRIVHSSAFRRLQTKTQVMGTSEGEFHRTRLTHSIEVGQIGRSLCQYFLNLYQNLTEISEYIPDQYLIEAICYAHDIGHPPFGHGGEVALHQKMMNYGGFEGNAQTIRQLTKLEQYYSNEGIRPTRRLVLGVLKYPAYYDMFDKKQYYYEPPKCYYNEDAELIQNALSIFEYNDIKNFCKLAVKKDKMKTVYKSFDASIMEAADDISYGVHDLEDAIARQLLYEKDFTDEFIEKCNTLGIKEILGLSLNEVTIGLFDRDICKRKKVISYLVAYFIKSSSVVKQGVFSSPYLDLKVIFNDQAQNLLSFFKNDIGVKKIIKKPEIQTLDYKGKKIISNIFDAVWDEPLRLIGKEYFERYMGLEDIIPLVEKNGENWADRLDTTKRSLFARAICDFIAQKSDLMAERYYKRLFVPDFGNATDEL